MVLAWCPTFMVMETTQRLEKSVIVLVEWIPGEFDAWAMLVGAYNVVTGKVMDAGLSDEAEQALKGIVDEGYNGWTKTTNNQLIRRHLDGLAETGSYDCKLVLAYARRTTSERSVARLRMILDMFETSRGSVGSSRNSRE